uniref:SOWAHA-C winged helix-turn-helix domain-containing protein n=1 Tax=Clytia hemisphaerica TaxID=252671 RepID=A0A7M5V8M5_9CNID
MIYNVMADKENDEIITIEAVCEFLQKRNGKARQAELVNHFRKQLNSPNTKVRARQEFRDILQLVTATKTENGEKYVVLVMTANTTSTSNSVITRKSQRPLSIRKEIGRSRCENLLLPLTPRSIEYSDDETDGSIHSVADSGMGSETSSIRSVASLRQEMSRRLPGSLSMDSIDTLMDGTEDDLEEDLGLTETSEVLPEEKSWMLAAAHGNIKKLESLLKEYPSLAKKKDFVMGYTALHWAAKLGRTDIVKFIMGANVDIHSKSHGGYTPLHIAAMSGRDQVIVQLIELYNANIHTRDHSGKKPRDVVKDTVAADVQRKLGRSLILEPDWMLKDASVVRKSSAQLTHITLPSPKSGDRRLGRNFRPSIST